MKSEITLKEIYERLVALEVRIDMESGSIQTQISTENNIIMKKVRKYVYASIALIVINILLTIALLLTTYGFFG